MQTISDGRLITHKLGALERSEETNSIVFQAVETLDGELLDWCIENMNPPVDVPASVIQHLIYFLAGRFWVHSDPKALSWIKSVIMNNKLKIKGNKEIEQVMEDLKGKLRAKAEGVEEIGRIRDRIQMIFKQEKAGEEYTLMQEAQILVNEEEEMEIDS